MCVYFNSVAFCFVFQTRGVVKLYRRHCLTDCLYSGGSLDREAAGGSEGQVRLGPGGDVPGAEGGDEIGGRGGREDGEVQPIPRVVKAECDHVSSLVTAGQTLTW